MARLAGRDRTEVPEIERPPVEGLEPGAKYRRRRGAPSRWPGSPREAFGEAGPLVTFLEPAAAGDKHEGRGGWFRDKDGQDRFYLAEDVVPAAKSGHKARAGQSGAPPGQTCFAGDGRDRYSQGLCTRCYGRARRLVKEESHDWDQAREAVKAEIGEGEG